jgi:ABC-type sulfate transport system permease subunit
MAEKKEVRGAYGEMQNRDNASDMFAVPGIVLRASRFSEFPCMPRDGMRIV